jgi:hypothetical protein
VFAYEPSVHSAFWLWQEYFPAAGSASAASELPVEQVAEAIGADRVETVLVPHDCSDGVDRPPILTPMSGVASRG